MAERLSAPERIVKKLSAAEIMAAIGGFAVGFLSVPAALFLGMAGALKFGYLANKENRAQTKNA